MSNTFYIPTTAKVFAYSEPVNMARGVPGLSEIVETKLKSKPSSGDLYFFFNKSRNYVKVLYWAKNGWCIFAKRTSMGIFNTKNMPRTVGHLQRILDDVLLNEQYEDREAA